MQIMCMWHVFDSRNGKYYAMNSTREWTELFRQSTEAKKTYKPNGRLIKIFKWCWASVSTMQKREKNSVCRCTVIGNGLTRRWSGNAQHIHKSEHKHPFAYITTKLLLSKHVFFSFCSSLQRLWLWFLSFVAHFKCSFYSTRIIKP